MALTKAPLKPTPGAAETFISGAPDATVTPATAEATQNKRPITITFDPVLLGQLDAAAKRMGISRSSAMAVAVSRWLGLDHA